MRDHLCRLIALTAAGFMLASSSNAFAQKKEPPKTVSSEEKGTLEGIAPGKLQLKTGKNEVWHVSLGPNTKVAVTGTAEMDYLRPGLNVRLQGEIDSKGTLQGDEIKDLEIFTPVGKNALGLFPVGADADAKPLKKFEAGTYDIKAKITKYKDNELTLIVLGKNITGKVADGAAISVNVSDLSVAQAGDVITAKLMYPENAKAEAEKKPGSAMAEEVGISLSNPLTRAKKGKTPKGKAPKGGDKPSTLFPK